MNEHTYCLKKDIFGGIIPKELRWWHWKCDSFGVVAQVEVELVSDSMDVSRGLDVLGYDVRGRVTSDGEPIQGVLFSLYAPAAAAASGASGRHCGLEAPAADSAADVATLEVGALFSWSFALFSLWTIFWEFRKIVTKIGKIRKITWKNINNTLAALW